MTELLPENRSKGRLAAFLRNRFYEVFCGFPFIVALVFGVISFFNPDMDGRRMSLLLVLVFFGLCALWLWFAGEPQGRAGRLWRWLYMPMAVWVCAAAIRIAWAVHVGPYVEPFSDFDWAYQAALGSTDFIRHHATFPSWGLYVGLIRLVINISSPAFISIQIFNALVNSFTVILVYYITLLAAKNFKVAVVAGLMMCFMPSNILYTSVLSPEIPSLLLLLLVILGMIVTFKPELRLWIRVIILISVGAVCAVANYLKAVAVIAIIAYVIAQVMYLRKRDTAQVEDKKKPLIKQAAIVGLSIVLMAVPFLLTTKAINRYVEQELGVSINHSQMSHFLFVGLNTKGEGQIHIGEYNHMDLEFLAEHDYDYELTDQWVREFLRRDWSDNYEDIPALFFSKIQWAWQDDMMPAAYTGQQIDSTNMDSSQVQVIEQYAPSLSQAFYVVFMLLAVVGSIGIRKQHADNNGYFLLCMYIFGVALVLLLSEAQSRYKCMVTPVICILSSVGLETVTKGIKERILHIWESSH